MNSKFFIIAAMFALGSLPAYAGFETWTSADGRPAQMELVGAQLVNGQVVGTFRLQNGSQVTLTPDKLSAEDGDRLKAKATTPGTGSAFSKSSPAVTPDTTSEVAKMLGNDLKKADGRKLTKGTLTKNPEYYILYDSASWCPPCRQITPEVVKLYGKSIKDHPKFEFVLLSHDENADDMEGYAKEDKMEWLIAPNDSKAYKKLVAITNPKGIPHLSVLKPDGSVVFKGHPGSNLNQLEELLATTK